MALTTKQKVVGGTILTLVLGTGTFFTVRHFRKKNKSKRADKNFDKSTYKTPSGAVNVIETARKIGMDLGTAYPWYDPRRATENDNAVRDTLLKFPKSLISQLRTEYATLFPGRNLQQDLQELLDDYPKVQYLFVS